jgi:hypothetical protein
LFFIFSIYHSCLYDLKITAGSRMNFGVNQVSLACHGEALLDLRALLQPGITKVSNPSVGL